MMRGKLMTSHFAASDLSCAKKQQQIAQLLPDRYTNRLSYAPFLHQSLQMTMIQREDSIPGGQVVLH